jgi:maltose O-acetyltransferase
MILKNSEVGKNTIVAAGSVVTGSFPSNVIIGGVPAKIIKMIDGKEN